MLSSAESAWRLRWESPDEPLPFAPWCPCPNCRAPVDEEDRFLVFPGFEPNEVNLGCAACIEEDAHLAEPAPTHLEDRIRRRHSQDYFQ
jgi:hypothetical protein